MTAGWSTASSPKFHTQCVDVTVLHTHSKFHMPESKDLLVTPTKPIGLQQLSRFNRLDLHSENTIQKLYILVGLLAPAITSGANIADTRQVCNLAMLLLPSVRNYKG